MKSKVMNQLETHWEACRVPCQITSKIFIRYAKVYDITSNYLKLLIIKNIFKIVMKKNIRF